MSSTKGSIQRNTVIVDNDDVDLPVTNVVALPVQDGSQSHRVTQDGHEGTVLGAAIRMLHL